MTTFRFGGPERYAHQRRGLEKMLSTGGVTALLFDPGTGKTATVLDYSSILALKRGEVRVLVVCPLVAVDTWVSQAQEFVSPDVTYWAEALGGSLIERSEALAARGGSPYPARSNLSASPGAPRALHWEKAWAWASNALTASGRPITASEGPEGMGDAPARLVLEVINIDTFSRRDPLTKLLPPGSPGARLTLADRMVDAVKRFRPDLVVVDESHKIKSSGANASRVLARISQSVSRRIILTGTVMPHSPLDVFGQWRFLDPYAFGYVDRAGARRVATFTGFKSRYAVMGGYMGYEVVGYRNLDEMQDIMARNAVVARKSDALDLPPTTDVEVPVNLSSDEATAYRDMKQQLAATLRAGQQVTVPNMLTQILRLRQITSGHVPDDNGAMHVIGTSKVDVIDSLVHDTLVGENRIVIFCLFSQEIEMLCRRLPRAGTEVMRIEGGTATEDRLTMRKRFGDTETNPERIVLVAQIKTLSLAVNELVSASHAIFGSLSQQRDDLVQARDRLNRIGQTKPVTFWYPLVRGTIDEVILKAHRDRTDLETAVLAHILDS